ncbi:DUF1475 family protein [Stenotrophobium rhamnosiphilum]|uniref:DUF1475 domain-containing protein n=1 Tax=Stenotrophobium rhamnosiphilum TaxID=2029166 RepID=A0A2T5MF95_9GAMM|nr:DUF1475 family protein [Stenotrophobium rhamnosiphilum]PTU31251.1 DUF1475 domain-containing protein [Stenotrophobium rhamnosiphilum]
MKFRLGLFALTALAALISVSIWATGHISISPVIDNLLAQPGEGNNPWFVATLLDAYFGFLWFWAWVAYKERSWLSRVIWLVLILGLGNMAMGAYILIQLYRLPADAKIEDLLLRRG